MSWVRHFTATRHFTDTRDFTDTVISLMRYFTRGWANGELDDAEGGRVVEAYQRRLEAIMPRLPAPARVLAREVSLHDAIIESVRWHPAAKELTLTLATVDPSGYHTVALTYRGALLGVERVRTLREVARDRETEVLYSEVDIDDDGLLAHRMLFWPRDELTIDFGELGLEVTSRDDRRVSLGGAFVEVDDAPAPDLLPDG